MRKRILSFILIINILFFSLVPTLYRPVKVEAAATTTTVLGITGFILSCIGAVNILSNGGVGRASSQAVDAVKQKVADLMGTGIYEDSNGNYVFSGQATQDIYDALQGSQPTRVISTFEGASFMGGLTYYNTAYMSSEAISTLNSWRSLYNDYMVVCFRYNSGGNSQYRRFIIYDLSNVAFIKVGSNSSKSVTLFFYNSAGNSVYVDCKEFSTSSNSFNGVSSGNRNQVVVCSDSEYFSYGINLPYYLQDNDIGSISDIYSYVYNNIPFRNNYSLGGSLVWSNKSLILSQSTGSGYAKATQQEGLIIANSFNQFPTISKTVIENNDWDYIYQSYVNNVNSQVSNYYDGTSVDTEKLLEYMQSYCNNINYAIQQGTENIEQAVLTSNEWLERIYKRLKLLQDILDNMGEGGSSGGSCTEQDIQDLLDFVDRIDSNLALTLDESESIYVILGSILQAIQTGASPSSPHYYLPDIDVPFDIIDDLPDSSILNHITKGQIISGLLEDSFPLALPVMIGSALSVFNSQPVAPQFTIPIKMTTLANIDEEIEVDFTDFGSSFDNIRNILQALCCMMFGLVLLWLSIELIWFLIDLLK